MEFNIGTGVVKLFKCFVSSKKEDKGGGEEGFFFVGRLGSRSCFVLLCLSNLYIISETPFGDQNTRYNHSKLRTKECRV